MKNLLDKHREEFRAAQDILETLDCKTILLTDKPDIVVETNSGRRIGIEVTKCIVSNFRSNGRNNLLRANNNILKAEKAYRKILEDTQEPLIIEVHYFPDILNQAGMMSQKQVVDLITEEIKRHRKYDRYIDEFYSRINEPKFREEYNAINNNHSFEYKFVESIDSWNSLNNSCDVFHFCVFLFSEDIRLTDINESLRKKDSLIDSYKMASVNSKLDDFLLVINVPSDEYISIENYVQQEPIESSYTHIYLTNSFSDPIRLK